MALKLSVMSDPAPSQAFEQPGDDGQFPGQTVAADPSPPPPPPPAAQHTPHDQSLDATENVTGANGGITNGTATTFRGTGEDGQWVGAHPTGYTAASEGGFPSPLPLPPPPPPPPPLPPGNPIGASAGASSGLGERGGGVAVAGGSVGAVVVPRPLLVGSAEAQTADAWSGGGVGAARRFPAGALEEGRLDEEDEDERALRVAMEEEHRYFEGQENGGGVVGVVASDDGHARHDGGVLASAANLGAGGGAGEGDDRGSRVPPGEPLAHVAGRAEVVGGANVGGGDVGVENVVGGGEIGGDNVDGANIVGDNVVGGGDGREVEVEAEVDEDLARVLEQSRLEAEGQGSLRAEREEEVMARVMEESRQEQERRNMEQLEFQRVRGETMRGGVLSSSSFIVVFVLVLEKIDT